MSQKDNLLAFLQGNEGVVWASQRTGWDEETDECEWDGVECNAYNHVTILNLEGSNLIATIPPQVSKITSLTHLYLGSNKLYGTVPNELSTNLPNLVQIDLSVNKLRGSIPLMKESSSSMEIMNFAHNQFEGTLPVALGKDMERLKILDVKYNRIKGIIPPELGTYASGLVELDLSNNLFSGSIPESLGSLTNLLGLFLSNNDLVGPIPHSLSRDHLALSQIFLHSNRLSGTVPVALADLPNLNILFIDENKLTGTVPQELCALNLNEAFFADYSNSNTAVAKSPPGMDQSYEELYPEEEDSGQRRKRMRTLASSDPTTRRDGCNSIACPSGYHSSRTEGKDGVFPCMKCEENSQNPYLGANKCFELDEGAILRNFYEGTNGPNWSMTANEGGDTTWSDESVPVCNKMGISCNLNGDITAIELPSMGLVGTISEGIGFLRHLEVLDLSDNKLSGQIPSDLQFAPLHSVDVSGNLLTGFVPPVLCQKSGINSNGEGSWLSCDAIACGAGSYSKTGVAKTGRGRAACKSCPRSPYLGSKVCTSSISAYSYSRDGHSHGVGIAILVITVCMMTGLLFLWLKVRAREEDNDGLPYEEDIPFSDDKSSTGDGASIASHSNASRSSITSNSGLAPVPPVDVQSGTFAHDLDVGMGREEWNSAKESHEVWLDVPKIS